MEHAARTSNAQKRRSDDPAIRAEGITSRIKSIAHRWGPSPTTLARLAIDRISVIMPGTGFALIKHAPEAGPPMAIFYEYDSPEMVRLENDAGELLCRITGKDDERIRAVKQIAHSASWARATKNQLTADDYIDGGKQLQEIQEALTGWQHPAERERDQLTTLVEKLDRIQTILEADFARGSPTAAEVRILTDQPRRSRHGPMFLAGADRKQCRFSSRATDNDRVRLNITSTKARAGETDETTLTALEVATVLGKKTGKRSWNLGEWTRELDALAGNEKLWTTARTVASRIENAFSNRR